MADLKTIDPGLVAKIVGSFIKHNEIPPGELPNLVAIVHRSLAELGKPAEVTLVPTPAVALNDSPAGLAAWIIEKFEEWSDCGGDLESCFSKDELLTNVMIYWVTQTIGSSFQPYRDFMKAGAARWIMEAAKGWVGLDNDTCGNRHIPKRHRSFAS